MGIYRGGYRQYEGQLLPLKTRFGVIFSGEFRRLMKGKWNRRLLLLAAIPLVVTLAVLVGKGMIESKAGTLPISLSLLEKMLTTEVLIMALLAASAGSGIIADDRAANSMLLYLARPLTPARYLLGKGLALGLLLSLSYLLPAVVYVLVSALFTPGVKMGGLMKEFLTATWICSFHVFFVTSVLLLFSSLGKRSRYIGLGWFALFFFSQMISKGAAAATGSEWAEFISLPDLFTKSLAWAFSPAMNSMKPLLVLLGLAALCLTALWFRFVRLSRAAVGS
jgi:ABC-type transport system involved in multi-copper enzyme maturation permease subunit